MKRSPALRVSLVSAASVSLRNMEQSTINKFNLFCFTGIQVGLRCQVSPGGRRGVVKYIGEVPEMKAGGYWVGVGRVLLFT